MDLKRKGEALSRPKGKGKRLGGSRFDSKSAGHLRDQDLTTKPGAYTHELEQT